ncbi:MAG: hypothetical protein HY821_12920 [Acidobacteria bacterium]|nr:hypothetical protein [Acidobacteriota bacterium]
MPGWAWLIAAAAVLYALHRLACWMEDRGWIYWTRSRGYATRAGNAFLEVQQLLEPSKKVVLEAKRDEKAQQDDAGDGES